MERGSEAAEDFSVAGCPVRIRSNAQGVAVPFAWCVLEVSRCLWSLSWALDMRVLWITNLNCLLVSGALWGVTVAGVAFTCHLS